jgi:hypothetical protein
MREVPFNQSAYSLPAGTGPVQVGNMDEIGFWDGFFSTWDYQYGGMIDSVREGIRFKGRGYDEQLEIFTPENISGYGDYLTELAMAKDQEHLDFIKANIDDRLLTKQKLERAGLTNLGVWAGSIVDPLNAVFALPVFGQLGLIAKGGMTVRQAAAASAKGGLALGIASEAVRAPFDRTNTMDETVTNLVATTMLSTIFGAIPSAATGLYKSIKTGAAKREELWQNKGAIGDEIDGISINKVNNQRPEFAQSEPRMPVEPAVLPMPVLRNRQIQPLPERGNFEGLISGYKADIKRLKKLQGPNFAAVRDEAARLNMTVDEYKALNLQDIKSLQLAIKKTTAAKNKYASQKKKIDQANSSARIFNSQQNAKNRKDIKATKEKNRINQKNHAASLSAYEKNLAKYKADLDAHNKAVDEFRAEGGTKFDRKSNKIVFDEAAINESYNLHSWTKPEVEGATPFRETDFNSPSQWGEYLANREAIRAKTKRKAGESQAAYVDRTNKEAYKRVLKGYGLAQTPFTSSMAFKILTTPGKRIMKDGTDAMRVFYHKLAGVDHMEIEGLANNRTQWKSVYRTARTHQAKSIELNKELQHLWSNDTFGRDNRANIFGYNTDDIVARSKGVITFDDWYQTVVEAMLQRSAGKTDVFSAPFEDAMTSVKKFFDDYKVDMQELGMINDGQYFKDRAKSLQKFIDNIEAQEKVKGLTEKQITAVKKAKDDLQLVNDLLETKYSDRYIWPIYYDKAALNRSEELRNELVDVFEEHIRANPITKVWNDKQNRFVDLNPETRQNPRTVAEKAVDAIMEEGDPITHLELSMGIPKGKHLRHRAIDIPEHKISKFILKGPSVVHSYAQRVGARVEYVRNFGNRSIDDILDEFEVEMRAEGKSEKKIAALRADMAFEYERTMGDFIQHRDRWDNQFGRATKEIAGMAYLDTAAIASITDVANIVFQHGFKAIASPVTLRKDLRIMGKALREVKRSGGAPELAMNNVQQRFIADNIEGISPNLTERILSPITRAYYNIPVLGNGLGTLTYFMKQIDGVYRSDKYMQALTKWADGKATVVEVKEMLRYGFTEQDAKIIAGYPFERGDKYIHANVDLWPKSTKQQRDLVRKFDTAMNAGIGNTILHATSFDKPRIMDGVAYVRIRPWMRNINHLNGEPMFLPDKRASTSSVEFARLETQFFTYPFQFMNFMLGATNRITAGLFDPMKQHRLIGSAALLGLGYTVLQLRHDDYWFENRSTAEIMQRTIDQSGLFGIYTDLAYTATHMAVGGGLVDAENSIIAPKYQPDGFDAVTEPFGAAPGMIASWLRAGFSAFNGDTDEASREFWRNMPMSPLVPMAGDFINDALD